MLLVFHNSIFHRAISLLVEMPAQALTTTVPPFQKLVLFSGNVMRSSVAGRTKAVNKKGNAEVEFVFFCCWDDTYNTNRMGKEICMYICGIMMGLYLFVYV